MKRLLLVALPLLACQPTLPPPEVRPAPAAAREVEQSHLLLYPESDAEALLGRAVQVSKDGGWTMSDTRAPGCEVSVHRQKASFHTTRQVDLQSMTTITASYAKFVSLEAKFGNANKADIDITNVEILRADTRGACGEVVVDTVFLGHGSRKLVASSEAGGHADLHVGVASASPKLDATSRLVDAIDWTDDQAYGFTFKQNGKEEPLELRVSMPSVTTEGDELEVRFESKVPAWLVVYYIDGAGHADVLWPSNEEPEPRVAPDAPAVLPSPKERAQGFKIKTALLKKGEPSRETLVVYGFADRRDFDTVKPAAGSENADGPAYAAALTKKLQHVPMSRWARAVSGYVIEPRR